MLLPFALLLSRMKSKDHTIVVPDKVSVFTDKKTQVKSVVFPFDFPSGAHGAITIIKLRRQPWNPAEDIETIRINFK